MPVFAERYHDICCGHRVYGHENKCANLHGHNYRFHFTLKGERGRAQDELGRVIDFSVIKTHLCQWLEENWDHKFLLWDKDPLWGLIDYSDGFTKEEARFENVISKEDISSFVRIPFNPTAENIAKWFVNVIAPRLLEHTGAELVKLKIEETRKCSAIYEKE